MSADAVAALFIIALSLVFIDRSLGKIEKHLGRLADLRSDTREDGK